MFNNETDYNELKERLTKLYDWIEEKQFTLYKPESDSGFNYKDTETLTGAIYTAIKKLTNSGPAKPTE